MANEKFTQLPTVVASTLADIIAAVQGGVSVQQTLQQVLNLSLANIILHNAGNPNGSVAGTIYQFCWDTTNSILYICTTSGNAATAVWTAAKSFATPLAMALGGTNAALTAANGAIPYSSATAIALLAAGTSGQLLRSGGVGAPTWTTATFPATAGTSGNVLVSDGTNWSSSASTLITALGAQTQALNMNTHLINNVVDPVSAQDAATKNKWDFCLCSICRHTWNCYSIRCRCWCDIN
jgi:hypothetical protein